MDEERAEEAPAGHPEPEPDTGIPEPGVQPRAKWANRMEFIFSMLGEIIGLGNIWRFPYLCYRNGGGVFLIPYLFFLLFCGVPVFILETALGQYTSEGGVTAWRKICPMFEGIGIASQVIVTYFNIYYIVVLAWVLLYLSQSFKNPLPWSTCDNPWNTASCTYRDPDPLAADSDWSFLHNVSSPDFYGNATYIDSDPYNFGSPEQEFWMNRVLGMSDDMSLGPVRGDLAFCLLLAWTICYFCVFMGIRSTGKVVYFTATVPYLMLFILFIRGVTLPGASNGLKYFLIPDISKLGHASVWVDAAVQVFFSYAMCQGVLTALGSYNKYNNNCYRDCLIVCAINGGTSIFAGLVVFSVLGFMAHDLNLNLEEVVSSGPGLVFIAIPKALSMLPGSSFWAVLFFLTLLFLGLDTQFVCVESLATALTDMFPRFLRIKRGREILVLVIAIVCFLLGLPLITEGGVVLFHVIDSYGLSEIGLLVIACFECIVIGWVYGADRFYSNIKDMIGYAPVPLLKYCWLFFTPILCWLTVMFQMQQRKFIAVYGFIPGVWATVVGGLLMITPIICIPVFIFVSMCRKTENIATPSRDLRQAEPHKPRLTLCGCVILKAPVQKKQCRQQKR